MPWILASSSVSSVDDGGGIDEVDEANDITGSVFSGIAVAVLLLMICSNTVGGIRLIVDQGRGGKSETLPRGESPACKLQNGTEPLAVPSPGRSL